MAVRQGWITRLFLVALLLGAAIGLGGLYYWRFRLPESMANLLRRFPQKDSVIIQIDLLALRQAKLLEIVAGSPVVEEEEYRRFVHETAFDYRTDLDLVILSISGDDRLALATGRFDLPALKKYVMVHGGRCQNGLCSLKNARGDRYVSFVPLRSNLVAWASSKSDSAANQLMSPAKSADPISPPSAPFWVKVPRSYWKSSVELPAGTKLFAKALEDAEMSYFSVSLDNLSPTATLEAYCASDSAADSLQTQLQGMTDVFRKYLERAKEKPNPGDLGAVLTHGTFVKQSNKVVGKWLLERQFLEAMIGGRL